MQFEELAKQFAKKELPHSEVEFAGEVPQEALEPYRGRALEHLASHMELPGFRPGKVPKDLALKKIGDMALLEEALELFIKDFYPALIEHSKTDAVGRPDIRVTKLAPGNPCAIVIRTAVYPQVVLPKNWKSLAAEVPLEPSLPATDEEVNKTLEDVRQSRKKEGVAPELSDEFAKSIGAFEGLEHLKTQIRQGITEEKARHARDTRRGKLIERLLKDTKVEVPAIFVESELEKILSQMREDVERMGLKFSDYLTQASKTEEALRADFKDQAGKRAKLQLALNKIAQDEKLEADPTAIEGELKHAMGHFPEANPELVRVHIETVLRNELALKLLEAGDKKE
jgi:FKBP-type peptidyl-prolyl cis-trans isomerase (trigger factor)